VPGRKEVVDLRWNVVSIPIQSEVPGGQNKYLRKTMQERAFRLLYFRLHLSDRPWLLSIDL
jgi:hypothetical protein